MWAGSKEPSVSSHLDSFAAATVLQMVQEVTNWVLPIQNPKWRAIGINSYSLQSATVDSKHRLVHETSFFSLDVHQILPWKSHIIHCFQKIRLCNRHHSAHLSFRSYSYSYYFQFSSTDLNNIRLIISLINHPDPRQNSHIQRKTTESGLELLLHGVILFPERKRVHLPRWEKKIGQVAGNTWSFLLMPLSKHSHSSKGRAVGIFLPVLHQDSSSWHC